MDKFVSGIYKIENIKNGHIYIGSSSCIRRRFIEHKSKLNKNNHGNKKLQSAYNSYGGICFKFEILELCDVLDLMDKEQYYINLLNPSYNLAKTAYLPINKKMTIYDIKKIKQKLARNKYNRYYDKNIRIEQFKESRKINLYFKNGDFVQEFNNQREIAKYLGVSRNTIFRSINSGYCIKKKYRVGYKNKPLIPYKLPNSEKRKKVYVYNLDGDFIKSFDFARDAATFLTTNDLNFSENAILFCCRNRQKQHNGYIFKYN